MLLYDIAKTFFKATDVQYISDIVYTVWTNLISLQNNSANNQS